MTRRVQNMFVEIDVTRRGKAFSPPFEGHQYSGRITPMTEGKSEIGRILHFKAESRNRKLDPSILKFRSSVLKCRIRPFPILPGSLDVESLHSGRPTFLRKDFKRVSS